MKSWKKSKTEAEEQASSQKTLEKWYQIGKEAYDKKNYTEAVTWFQKAAEQGYAKAQSSLGNCYLFGRGVKIDYQISNYWFQKAANQGNSNGQYAIGASYEFGAGVKKNYTQALYWYRKAAAQGHAGAEYKIEQLSKLGIV